MALIDLINSKSIDSKIYPFKEDFAEVIGVNKDKKTVDLKLTFRAGIYKDINLIDTYFPQKGEKGIIYFIGGSNTPMFQPLKPTEQFDIKEGYNFSYSFKSKKDAPSQSFINLYDLLNANPEYKKYIIPLASYEDSWGVPDWVSTLLVAGKAFYEATQNMLMIKHIYNIPSHKGIGHHSGTGADAYSTPDNLHIIGNLNQRTKEKVKVGLGALFGGGVKGIMWGLNWCRDKEAAQEIIDLYDNKMIYQTREGGKGDSKHILHWHLSYRIKEEKF